MRILGLDIGDKRIGVSVSDELGITAQPLETIEVSSGDSARGEIKRVVEELKVSEIIAGLPLSMDGSDSERTRTIRAFIEKLERDVAVPVKTWDERLSSLQVERVMISAGLSRKKRKSKSDRLAAQVILQSYLDSRGA